MATLLLAAAFGTAVKAMAIEAAIAQPTDASIPHPTFKMPTITPPPSLHELLRRDEVETILVGPDNTCGYVSGLLGAAYTCGNTAAYCAFVTTASYGAVACCDTAECAFRVDCVDYQQISSSQCDNGCMVDAFTVKCTNTALPYCGTIVFSSSITDYFCQDISYSTSMVALTTWIGETDGREYSELVVTLTSDVLTTRESSLVGSGSATRSSSGASSTAGGSSGGSPGTSSGGNSGGGGGSSTSIGAIVGGAVGGVAVLALIGFAIWFLVRRNKKNKATNTAPPPAYPQMQQSPPPGGPSPGPMGAAGHQSVYQPQYPQQPGQQYQQGYPQQAGYFSTQEKPTEPYVVQAPAQPTSPVSQVTDNRMSMQPSSPTSTLSSFQPQHTGGYQPQMPNVPSTVHEAGGDQVGIHGPNSNHHGQLHELN
ncbi:hypothetical protein BJ170DRAFT_482691 [Xylariales sp. AK1849]|nr:hypothetical protein BJ170DRAFT_482691 [Xylariales sp. AK1849]